MEVTVTRCPFEQNANLVSELTKLWRILLHVQSVPCNITESFLPANINDPFNVNIRGRTVLQLSPWMRILLQKLIVGHVFKTFLTFYGNKIFTIVLARARHCTLS
jgi:hypothetical protein